jgi:chemotaxis protein methyltransferase CheR
VKRLSDAQLQRLSDFAAHRFGLHFPQERWRHLEGAVCAAAQDRDPQHDLDHYLQQLFSPALTPGQLEVLAAYLTVSETYFCREKQSLEVFETHVIPELIRTRAGKTISIWSAGCATGEEPYSIAIILSRLMAGLKEWQVDVLATDLNFRSLQKASAGIYGEWSFRETPPSVRNAYFETSGKDRWAVSPAIKKMVRFSQLNLVDDSFPLPSHSSTGFDVIFCRNVLMYLTPQAMRKVIEQLYRSLANEGWLIVSPAEMSHRHFSQFAAVDLGGVTLYRKSALRADNPFAAQLPELQPETFVYDTSTERLLDAAHADDTETQVACDRQATASRELHHGEDGENGNDAQAILLLARSRANQGKLAAALLLCDQAIAADKMAAPAYYLRGAILQEQGAVSEALLAFRRTVYAEPEFVLGHFALGHLALRQGRLRESEKYFENALLLLARYEPEDAVPESEGLSAGALRQMIVSQLGAPLGASGTEPSERMFYRSGKARTEKVMSQ